MPLQDSPLKCSSAHSRLHVVNSAPPVRSSIPQSFDSATSTLCGRVGLVCAGGDSSLCRDSGWCRPGALALRILPPAREASTPWFITLRAGLAMERDS